jgi:outer membrane protein OmpA-like peptidoglycan-associated protein
MIGGRVFVRRGGKSEAEKPFWISFADLMTALMVLFLVVMAVTLLAVTKTVSEQQQKEAKQKADIDECLLRASEAAKRHDGVKVDIDRRVIDFGDRARYDTSSYALTSEQKGVLRRFVPELLTLAGEGSCKRVLKRIVVEGYTDKTGFYLNNLSLSLMRSRGVLCAMYETSGPNILATEQKEAVRDLFLVGGFAFNSAKETLEESRRVEMRLEFLGIGEKRPVSTTGAAGNFGTCAQQ